MPIKVEFMIFSKRYAVDCQKLVVCFRCGKSVEIGLWFHFETLWNFSKSVLSEKLFNFYGLCLEKFMFFQLQSNAHTLENSLEFATRKAFNEF